MEVLTLGTETKLTDLRLAELVREQPLSMLKLFRMRMTGLNFLEEP